MFISYIMQSLKPLKLKKIISEVNMFKQIKVQNLCSKYQIQSFEWLIPKSDCNSFARNCYDRKSRSNKIKWNLFRLELHIRISGILTTDLE